MDNVFIQYLPLEKGVESIIWEQDDIRVLPYRKKKNMPRPIEELLPSVAEALTALYEDYETPLWQEVRTDMNKLKYDFLAGKTKTPLKERVEIFNNYFQIYYSFYASKTEVFPYKDHPHCKVQKRGQHIANLYASYILGRATQDEINFIENIKKYGLASDEVFSRAFRLDKFNNQLLQIIPYEKCLKSLGLTEEDVAPRKEFWKKKTKDWKQVFKNMDKLQENIKKLKVSEVKKVMKSLYTHYHWKCRGSGILLDIGIHACTCIAEQAGKIYIKKIIDIKNK